jgi:hypothetical protein
MRRETAPLFHQKRNHMLKDIIKLINNLYHPERIG